LGKGAFVNPGVLLVGEGDYLTVFATDLDNWLIQRMPVYEGQEGKAYIPVKEMLSVLKGEEDGSVVLEREDSVLVVKLGDDAVYRINLYNDEEFPAMPDFQVSEGLMVDMNDLLTGVEKVGWCASKDDPRPFLTGIYMHTKDGALRFVASDASVLGFYALPNFSGDMDVILPAHAQSILKTLPKGKGIMALKDKVFQMTVEEESVNATAILRGIDDSYVDYEGIIPTEFVAEATADTDLLRRKIERMLALAPNSYEIEVEIGNGEITLRTISSKGEGVERIKTDTVGEVKVRLIGSSLVRMLKSIDSPTVRLSFSGESTPAKIGPTDNENHFYLILPIS